MTLVTEVASSREGLVDSLQIAVQRIHASAPNGGRSWVLRVAGEIDWTTSPDLQSQIGQLLTSVHPARLIVDCTDVTHLDSSGVGVLLWCLRDAKKGRVRFMLAGLSSVMRRMFERTRLDTLLEIRPTVQDALRA